MAARPGRPPTRPPPLGPGLAPLPLAPAATTKDTVDVILQSGCHDASPSHSWQHSSSGDTRKQKRRPVTQRLMPTGGSKYREIYRNVASASLIESNQPSVPMRPSGDELERMRSMFPLTSGRWSRNPREREAEERKGRREGGFGGRKRESEVPSRAKADGEKLPRESVKEKQGTRSTGFPSRVK